jgi:hypothetical protein
LYARGIITKENLDAETRKKESIPVREVFIIRWRRNRRRAAETRLLYHDSLTDFYYAHNPPEEFGISSASC